MFHTDWKSLEDFPEESGQFCLRALASKVMLLLKLLEYFSMFLASFQNLQSILFHRTIYKMGDGDWPFWSSSLAKPGTRSRSERWQKTCTMADRNFTQQDNNFEYRGRDAEDNGTRWWEAQWAKDDERARREKEQREARGAEEVIEKSQRYFPTTAEELEAFTWYQQAREHEKEQRAVKKAAAERSAAEKQREEVFKAIREAEAAKAAEQEVFREAKRGGAAGRRSYCQSEQNYIHRAVCCCPTLDACGLFAMPPG